MAELVPVVSKLARQAAKARMGLNIDAEEADRLGLSLKVIEAVLDDPELAGWDGFGVVVQAYGRRAPEVLDGLYELAQRLDRRIMVRLVKGAYWDTEIKHAQVEGLTDFPVYTRKAATDVSLDALAAAADGFSGAEIEQGIVSALYEAYGNDVALDQTRLLAALRSTRPLSILMAEKVQALRRWASERCVAAE
jgi:hypothetical protein